MQLFLPFIATPFFEDANKILGSDLIFRHTLLILYVSLHHFVVHLKDQYIG